MKPNRQTVEEYLSEESLLGGNIESYNSIDGELVLLIDDKREVWQMNDGHASFGITHDGHDFEFCRSE